MLRLLILYHNAEVIFAHGSNKTDEMRTKAFNGP